MQGSVARSHARPPGMQTVVGSILSYGNILLWSLVMKYFLWRFTPFRWFKTGNCQLLSKECAPSTGKLPGGLPRNIVDRLTMPKMPWNVLKGRKTPTQQYLGFNTQFLLMNGCKELYTMGRVKRIWYLSPMRAAKVQASLRIFRQKARSLAPLNGWACAVKICHDGMLKDTNSLDASPIFLVI